MSRDPLTEVFDGAGEAFDDAIDKAGTALWEYRVEATYVVALALAYAGLFFALHRSAVAAGVILYALLMMVLWARPTRTFLKRSLAGSRVRRGWDEATRHCGFPHRIPLSRVESVMGGHRARVRVGRGISFPYVEQRREQLAACLGIRELRVKRDPHNASTGTLTFVRTDPLADRAGTRWPGLSRATAHAASAASTLGEQIMKVGRSVLPYGEEVDGEIVNSDSFWDPIPVGIDEHGEVVTITLPERSLLIGGSPGAGKSIALSMPLARAAVDPNTYLWLIDGKGVDFVEWETVADGVAHEQEEAIYLLRRLREALTVRNQELRERRFDKVTKARGLKLHALFIDELMFFTAAGDPKANKEFSSLLLDLLARGRAGGIVPCCATQKPEGSVVSTNIRDLFAFRWALRCGNREASDTVLGGGWAARGYNAALIPVEDHGVGYLLAEDGMPVKHRSFYLNTNDVRALAARAAEGRRR